MVEVLTLSLADHPNLVKLLGYCAERDERLLVYEFMPLGSLDKHLHGMLYIYFKKTLFTRLLTHLLYVIFVG